MRLAVLFDIHANLPGLEAVLSEIDRLHVDRVVVGGDVVVGPMPRETLARLRSLAVPVDFIYGNAETEVLRSSRGEELVRVPEIHRDLIHWTARELDRQDLDFITRWPLTYQLDVQGLGAVLFCHATPRDDNELFTRLTPQERLLPLFERLDVALVVCGHTHMQFDRTIGSTRVVNAGSVGMPFGRPGADWLLLGPDVELRHTSYDLEAAAERIRASGYPQAEEFASRYVLSPPSEEQMLAAFERVQVA